jgi:hypothetical protein
MLVSKRWEVLPAAMQFTPGVCSLLGEPAVAVPDTVRQTGKDTIRPSAWPVGLASSGGTPLGGVSSAATDIGVCWWAKDSERDRSVQGNPAGVASSSTGLCRRPDVLSWTAP